MDVLGLDGEQRWMDRVRQATALQEVEADGRWLSDRGDVDRRCPGVPLEPDEPLQADVVRAGDAEADDGPEPEFDGRSTLVGHGAGCDADLDPVASGSLGKRVSMSGPKPLPAAGWYQDPDDRGGLRYWDGRHWTEYRHRRGGDGSGRHHDAFICHSSKDKAVADAVVATLEAAGVRCWIAPRDVTPGDSYVEDIIEAIEGSALFVFVFSSHSNTSPHVSRELGKAVNAGLPVLPFRIEDITPSPTLEFYISNAHWLDALTPPLQAHLRRLAVTARLLLGFDDAADLPVTLPTGEDASPGPGNRRLLGVGLMTWLVLTGLLAAVALLAVVVGMVVGGGGGGEEAGTTPSSEPPATSVDEGTDDGVITGGGGVALDSLTEGDCYAYADGGFVDVVACEEAHDGEVFAALVHPAGADAPYPGAGELDSYALEECTAAYAERAGEGWEAQLLGTFGLAPFVEEWEAGDRTVNCFAEVSTGGSQIVGSVLDDAP